MKPRKTLLPALALMVMLPVTLMAQGTLNNSAFTISRSSDSGLQISFDLPQWKLENVGKDGQNLQRVVVDEVPYLFIDEEETLPVFSTLIAIPYSGGASFSLATAAGQPQSNVRLDFDVSLEKEYSSGRHSGPLYPAAPVLMSEPQVLRDFRVVSINVYPFQYDRTNQELIVHEGIDIDISFDNGPSVNEIAPPQRLSRSFEKIYRGLILNYDAALDREVDYQSPVILVIWGYNTDPIYQGKVNEYIAWKKQLGYIVYNANTNTTGTSSTAIKNYIQNAYNTWTDKPEYIVLIGDTSGSMIVPSYSTYTDYYYTWLAGGDNLGDVVIGRISVENTEQMTKYIAKINSLERNLNLDTAQWLDRMLLVGDSASSGISTIYTNEFIYDVSLPINPDYTYTKLYGPSPGTANMNAAINQGVSFFNYRGYIGMSGWTSVNYDTALSNAYRLFHAVIITCATGNFNSTGTTELVVRAGTEAQLKGAITAIGMATSSTHTPMNNCLDVGIFHGIYPLGMRNMGEAMLYGKLYLNAVYGVSNPSQAYNFASYCNLIGDPTALVYAGIPNSFSLNAPASIPNQADNVALTVKDSANQPVAGASVSLVNSAGTVQVLGFSDDNGYVLLDLPSTVTGALTVTVSKDDFKTLVSTINVNAGGGIIFEELMVDDGYGGSSSGNGDGIVNPSESIELWVTVRNNGLTTISASGTVSCPDPYVTIPDNRVSFGLVEPGTTAQNGDAIFFQVAPNCPDNRELVFTLSGISFNLAIPIRVRGGKLDILSQTFVGAPGNIVYPGDQYPLVFNLKNNGLADLMGVQGVLRSYDSLFSIQDSLAYFGNIAPNATISNSGDSFQILAQGQCIDGMIIPLELYLYDLMGYAETLSLTLTIGQTTVTDPLGQDAYGYFIFDTGDTSYMQCPTYSWIPIAPAEGGSGTALPLTDPGSSGDEGDQVGCVSITTVNLPFPFKFYGETYTQASISSNGFIAFGSTTDSEWRNWRLPGAGGPNPMIAVFWDDLQLNTGSYVYTHYNASQHYYVVEWYNVISGYDRSTPETFQAILYDPVFYPTQTGDGQVKLQYKEFNNIDQGSGDVHPHGNFATIGIKNQTGTVGLEYSFNNSYPTAAAPLSDFSTLFITTRPVPMNSPFLALGQITVSDSNANGNLDSGEAADLSIRIVNHGSVSATGVNATLSTTDPHVSVIQATAAYGTVNASGNADPLSPFSVQVSASCPDAHYASFTLVIASNEGSWSHNFTLTLNAPVLEFGTMSFNDSTGNNNGVLDPGETVVITIPLDNSGGAESVAGTATLSCSTTGITILDGGADFGPVPADGFASLNFTISASSSMTIGTLATVVFNASAGNYSANKTDYIEVGAPLAVTIGTGTSSQSYPIDRYYNYSVHEAIYLASEIGHSGTIKSIGFYKSSGDDTNPITGVSVYLKHTTANTLATGNYSTTGYTLVYSGSFPNTATSGWMEVNFNPMFEYSATQNLSILIVKDYQQYIYDYPQWAYTGSGAYRARRNRSDSSMPTSLTASGNLPNLKLRIFPAQGALYPPQNLSASASHQSVALTWEAPIAGTPTGYKIFKNGSLLTTVTTMTYTDLAVTNGTSYSYYLKAAYSNGDSEASDTVTATPNALPPTNLVAAAGNNLVSLSWNAPTGRNATGARETGGRSISGYRVYRNGTPVATVAGTSYQDTGLVNGVSYTYYVTTVYADPEGESLPSNTATATPSMVSSVILGTGTLITQTNYLSPINLSYKSLHGQSIFTAAELNDAGVFGPVNITQMGFNVSTTPNLPLPNFLIRMKHTTDTIPTNWQTAANMVTVYTNPSYQPVAGGWDLLTFSTPFQWNGTDNIVVDTAFGLVTEWSHSGTLQYTSINNGFRCAVSDYSDQTNVFTGGNTYNRRPNVQFILQPLQVGPMIAADPGFLDFGDVAVGGTAIGQFTLQNNGDQTLSGSISTPAGYTVSLPAPGRSLTDSSKNTRNTLAFSIPAGQSTLYQLVFEPSASGSYEGNVVVNSNAANQSVLNIAVTGSGNGAPTITLPDVIEVPMNGSLTIDFSSWLSDPEDGDLSLSASGNLNIMVNILDLNVTFIPSPGWFGSEELEFIVSDGLSDASDQVTVIVELGFLAAPEVSISNSVSGVLLQWITVPNATEYQIYRSVDPLGAFNLLGITPDLSFLDPESSDRAFYYVKAVNNP